MSAPAFKKWLAFGTGVGIEMGREDLIVTVVRLRPSGVRVLGELTIPRFREQPAAEWGENYAAFLEKLGVRHLAATILLPRDEVTVRQVQLPGVSDKDLAAAVRFEIDSLNPYSEEDVAYDGVRIGKTASILIGVTRRSSLERYSALLSQAGVKIASFTFSGPAIYSALRLYTNVPADGLVALGQDGGEVEIYGESTTRPLFSARLDQSADRARTLAVAELRLPPEIEAGTLHLMLPQPVAVPENYDSVRSCLSYAAAISSAILLPSFSLNLLPPEQRRGASRLRYVPTAVLGSLVLLFSIAVLAYPKYSDDQYLDLLEAQIRRLSPLALKAATAERETVTARNRAQTLDTFRQQTREDLDALNELTHLLAPPAWLDSMQLTRTSVSITGQTQQAASLIKLLDGSHHFQGSSFALPLQKSAGGELFSIRSTRKGVTP
ncbi:MAG TPA: PilN domain-containing protein [Bryobacteraceae bacterium]|nr:PilN domain-containing protein [Bryobacteraceae bacterium]